MPNMTMTLGTARRVRTLATAALAAIAMAAGTAAVVGFAPSPGVDRPEVTLPHWKRIYTDDFNGKSLNSHWGAYSGQPGGNPGGWWSPSHVAVANGALTLRGSRDGAKWTTGGVMLGIPTTYGKYEVRFRMFRGKGVKYVLLLWPKSDNWPIDGEIDFAEDGGGNRTTTSATLHYGADNSQIQRSRAGSFDSWQTLGVEWTPGKLVYTMNGKAWSTITTSHVPKGPMNLAIQTEAGTCGERWTPCPDSSTPAHVDMQVDWVAVFTRT